MKKKHVLTDKFICKFQRSQFPFGKSCMIYPRSQKWIHEFPMTPELSVMFGAYGEKFYAKCKEGKNKKLEIKK